MRMVGCTIGAFRGLDQPLCGLLRRLMAQMGCLGQGLPTAQNRGVEQYLLNLSKCV